MSTTENSANPPKKRPRPNHSIAQPKGSDEERKAFCVKQFRPKWQAHPIKKKILKWIEDGFTIQQIIEKIERQAVEDCALLEDYSLSTQTVMKIRRRHLNAIGARTQEEVRPRISRDTDRVFSEEETVLRKTIQECAKKKEDVTISPKDWQYYDIQQQAAISLLNQLKSEGKSGEDIAIVLSRVFAQFLKQFNASPNGSKAVSVGASDNAGEKKDEAV